MTEPTSYAALIDATKRPVDVAIGPSNDTVATEPPRRTLREIERDIIDARRQLAALQRDIGVMAEMRDKLGTDVRRLRQEFGDALDALFPGMYPGRL